MVESMAAASQFQDEAKQRFWLSELRFIYESRLEKMPADLAGEVPFDVSFRSGAFFDLYLGACLENYLTMKAWAGRRILRDLMDFPKIR